MKKLLLVSTVVLGLTVVQGQAQITFEKTYSVINSGIGESVQQTNDGGYILTGYSYTGNGTVILLKTDAFGNKQWDKYLGDNETYSVLQNSDGGYTIAGRVYINSVLDVLVIRTDANGDTLWRKTYGGIQTDDALSINPTTDNGYIIGGRTYVSGMYYMYILKIDANGNQIWSKSYGGGSSFNYPNVQSVQQTNDGGYILAGTAVFGGNEYSLVKTDSDGNLQWYNTQGGGFPGGASSGCQLFDGGYVITSREESGGHLIRTDNLGNIIWNKFYSTGYGEFLSVQQTADSGLIAVGASGPNLGGPWDVLLMKTNINGDSIWSKKFGVSGATIEVGTEVKQTSDGGYIIVGKSGVSFYLIKTDGNGNTTSIAENNPETDFTISPNPFFSSTTLQTDKPFHNATLTLYNSFGQQVKQLKNISGQEIKLQKDNLPSGLYFIRLTTPSPSGEGWGEVIATEKLIITDY